MRPATTSGRTLGGPAAAALALLLAAAPARPQDRALVPGRMGYNALPAVPNEDPAVGDDVLVSLQLAAQAADLSARDAAATPYLRVEVPFRGIAALSVDAVPVELWRVTPATQRRLQAASTRGVELGDVRFGARFLLVSEAGLRPALGIRLLTKTASGKGLENRRFTAAPAYLGDLLLGKDLASWPGGARVRLLAKAGFLSWQQGDGWQDDGLDYGATLQLRSAGGARLELEWRGYTGYERDDEPMLAGLTAGVPTGPVEWVLTVNRGLRHEAPPWEVRAGAVLRLPSPWRAR
ncbi:hypothetical protein [Anaeromyxobacter paludicola]|uniref:Transporter n=1 Tax=Anaeromyxobacter paludicola TaxID=2918171 RepID=A0ABN6N512_9BACT|nr:hypothetical protein [Anaeromyxobacter paludicola]BDG08254.1 hypothetical protein AMPC_13670 [Anaeromyxobacter paludicola]